MRAFSVLLGVFLFSLLLPCAQAQELQPPSWELGWITDVDPKYIVELEDDWDVEGELVVFVNNERSNELNLALNYDFDEDGPFAFDGPESITVAANTNDSFTILISGVSDKEVRAFSPSSSLPLTLTAEESIGETSVGNQEIEADITVPRKYMLMPSIVPPQDTLFSGSWVEFSIEVSNLGNTQDAIREALVELSEHDRQYVLAGRSAGSDTQFAAPPVGTVLDAAVCSLHLIKNVLCIFVEVITILSDVDFSAGSSDQLTA